MNIYLKKIEEIAKEFDNRTITIMEVCGGHTNTIMKYGIRDILPKNIHLISGPGCPVCVTSQKDIDNMIALANSGIPVASYGDMMHVPGTKLSLAKAKSLGADVKMIYTANEMLKDENKHRVFFGIGFETTTPMTAYLLEKGICVYSAHKIMPPPMREITTKTKVDGFIDPGHVACIIGSKVFDELKVPQVISGFKKEQIIRGIYKLLVLIKEGKNEVINDYTEVVKEDGNPKARKIIRDNMKLIDSEWRGLGILKNSGLEPKNDKINAKIKYANILKNVKSFSNPACRCGEIIKGLCEPKDCKLFGKVCTPQNPIGACMVSETEGACGIAFKYVK
jgi:hydrogenase expression/formation protein HypD